MSWKYQHWLLGDDVNLSVDCSGPKAALESGRCRLESLHVAYAMALVVCLWLYMSCQGL